MLTLNRKILRYAVQVNHSRSEVHIEYEPDDCSLIIAALKEANPGIEIDSPPRYGKANRDLYIEVK